MPDNILKKWIKTKKGCKGLVIGTVVNDEIRVGWSLCHRVDNFDRDLAKTLAVGRVFTDTKLPLSKPDSIASEIDHMKDRCVRYFKKGTPSNV